MIRRVLLFAAATAATVALGAWLLAALASDEDKIRRLLAESAEAFDAGAVGAVLEGFAPTWRDQTLGIDREALRVALLYAFLRRSDGARYRVELDADAVAVRFDDAVPDERASAEFEVTLHRRRADVEALVWTVAVQATVAKVEGHWRIVGSTHRTLAGAMPR